MILEAHKFWDEALAAYRRAGLLAPDDGRWTYYEGALLFSRERYAEAIPALRSSLDFALTSLPVRLRLADSLLAEQRLDEAETEYLEILRRYPNSARAHYGLGRIAADRRQWQDAVKRFTAALDRAPRYRAARFGLSNAFRLLGNDDAAQQQLKLFERSGEFVPAPPDPLLDEVRRLSTDARVFNRRGVALMREGLFRQAIPEFETASVLDPRTHHALVNLMMCHARLGDFVAAGEYYARAIAVKSDLSEPYFQFALVRSWQDRYEEVEHLVRKALSIKEEAAYHTLLGRSLEERGKRWQAKQSYRRALEMQPGEQQARSRLGCLLSQEKNWAEAIRMLDGARPPGPGQKARNHIHLAEAYRARGNRDDAAVSLRLALHHAAEANDDDLARRARSLLERTEGSGR